MINIFKIILEDLNANVKSEVWLDKVKCIIASYTFHLVFLYRVGTCIAQIPMLGSYFRPFIEYIMRILFASDISLKSKIGRGFSIMHGHDIVIGSNVQIGKYYKIMNGVTLGNKDTESPNNNQPTVGDFVVIGTGAKILGDIHVGDNVVIGANSVVVKDVPSRVVVAGVPAKIIKDNRSK